MNLDTLVNTLTTEELVELKNRIDRKLTEPDYKKVVLQENFQHHEDLVALPLGDGWYFITTSVEAFLMPDCRIVRLNTWSTRRNEVTIEFENGKIFQALEFRRITNDLNHLNIKEYDYSIYKWIKLGDFVDVNYDVHKLIQAEIVYRQYKNALDHAQTTLISLGASESCDGVYKLPNLPITFEF